MTTQQNQQDKLRIAAISDLHVRETSRDVYQAMFAEMSQKADIILLCGDLTDLGMMTEAQILVKEVGASTIPVVAVLGNHDYESNNQEEIARLLQSNRVNVLNGTEFIYEKNGKKYGFTGVKGFGGGFRPSMWGRFGEPEQKAFYDAVAGETQQLENGLNRLMRTADLEKMFVLLHFSPIRETLHGELIELYAFLGSSRLEEVIERYPVAAVFHGHAHFGFPKGKTEKGIPVYNVALPIMQKTNPKQPYAIVEV